MTGERMKVAVLGVVVAVGSVVAAGQVAGKAAGQVDPSPVPAAGKDGDVRPANPALPTVWVVGDSTGSVHREAREEGEAAAQGWGVYFAPYFDTEKVNVVNAARGGRSTRTFRSEGLWAKVLEQVKAGDVVLLQLGQNDVFAINDATRARGTIKGVGEESEEIDNMLTKQHEVVHTFGWYVRQYVREAKGKGAVVIVMSLTPRDVWKDGRMERGAPGYREWARTVAEQEHVPFADVSEVMAREYEKLGQEKTAALYHAKEPVHVNTRGAALNAEWVAEALKGLSGDPLGKWWSAKGKAVPGVR